MTVGNNTASTRPPLYSGNPPTGASVTSLPAYTPPSRPQTAPSTRNTTTHSFYLRNKQENPWATLTLHSSARSPEQLPTFLKGDHIRGVLALDLESPDPILSIVVSVKGQVITGNSAGETITFLDSDIPLWSRDDPDAGLLSAGRWHGGRLVGSHSWPFSYPIPRNALVPPNGRSSTGSQSSGSMQLYQLPQTFIERGVRASVQYSLVVNISRSKFRVDSKMKTMFVYVPAIQPGPSSPLRRLAYQENSPLLGPEADPEGWKSVPAVVIQGRVFSARDVQVTCLLSIAKPLSFTRGSAIPCYMSLSCNDPQALDLLSASRAIRLCLRRRVKPYQSYAQAEYTDWHNERKPSEEDIAFAVWWPSTCGGPESPPAVKTHTSSSAQPSPMLTRNMDGEIKLAKSLKPTSAMARFSIDYSLVLLPFQAAAFVPAKMGVPLLQERIEIATMFSNGPRPRSYAPPEYDDRGYSSRPATAA